MNMDTPSGDQPGGTAHQEQPLPPEPAQAFQEIADRLASFYLDLSEALERKALGLLAFVGVLLSLAPLVSDERDVLMSCLGILVRALNITAIGGLLVAAIFGALVLFVQRFQYASASEFRRLFEEHGRTLHDPDKLARAEAEVRGAWARALFVPGKNQETSPLDDLRRASTRRATYFKIAVWFALVGVIATGLSVLTIRLAA